jgi:hypothetical protein
MSQITLTFENINNNGVPCKNPIIIITGQSGDIAFPCGDSIKEDGTIEISLPTDEFSGACITGVIKCEECSHCPEEEFEACLCEDSTDCPACSTCVNGICVSLCKDNEKCVNNTCCECETNGECPQGFYCDGCKCKCNGKVNDRGECVECLQKGDCGPCQDCINGQCVDIVCPNNLICIGGECGCPPGSKYDVATNSCIPSDECFKDADCPVCQTCISGDCVPIVCPAGYKCVDGECIYWPCSNTSCENGADCGKDCGCLDGECVPCYILECNGECQEALGCKCNSSNKCEPVNNCGQYCDGSTPCLDQNCTCYNNECVSCENFPCDPDQCSDKYNCGCQDGDCTGGNGCNDKFELKKVADCVADGCALEAIYTTNNKCACDPIEFKTKSINFPTTPGTGANLMTLEVKLYKNGTPYENFKNSANMGDDELVDATIKTTVVHTVDGVAVNPNVAPVNTVSVDGQNKVPNILIPNAAVARSYNGKGTVVSIEVRAENVKVNSNGCTAYKSKVIATYNFDFRTTTSTNTSLGKIGTTFAAEVSNKLTDNTSSRKPLFVWFKSNTGTFSPTKYKNDGVYNQSGFFRKVYGVKSNNVWTDKVNSPALNNELWNNLNYRATIDCGCGGVNGATLQNVIFCCTENIDYTISNCGKTITIPPFNVCSVNKKLLGYTSPTYKIPKEAQTYFWMIINGNKEIKLRADGGEIINNPFIFNNDTNISSVAFEQRYEGTPNVSKECLVEYTEDYEGPDYDVTTECGKIIVKKQASSPSIQSVTGKKGSTNITFTPSAGNTIWTATGGPLNMNGEVEVTVNFQNSCSYTKLVNITCQPEITAEPTDEFAKGECPGGTNPDVVVSVVSGFSAAAKFSKDGTTYVDPDSTTPTIQKTFTNFAAGTYTFYVKETINNVEVIEDVQVTIKPMVKPTLTKTDICGNTQGSITILGGAPSSTWKIFGPAFNGFSVSLGSNGNSTPVQVPIDKPGQYIARLQNDPTGSMCTTDLTIDVAKAGGTITPTIVMESQTVCNGAEVLFRIDDGGLNLTYNVSLASSNSGTIQDLNGNTISSLSANNLGTYNAKVVGLNNTGSTVFSSIIVNGIVNSPCYSISGGSVSLNFAVLTGPNIGNISISCSNLCQRDCYDIFVAISGNTTGVTIAGTAATQISAGVWRANVQIGPNSNPTVIATNGICTDQVEITNLPDCDGRSQCPEHTISISSNPDSPTCGEQPVTVYYGYSTIPGINGAEYRWYKTTGGIMQLLASGTVVGTTVPQLDVTSTFTQETYALMLVTNNGICEYTSNEVTVYADNQLSPEIFGAGISPDTTTLMTGNTYSYSTAFIPNGTYTWTLTNSNGSNQPVGTNSNAIQISSFTDGPNTINLTVSNGICTGTASVELNVVLSCPTVSIGLIGQLIGGEGCRNVGATINNQIPGVTVTSWAWYIDGIITSQTGTGSPQPFDASEIGSGENVDITLVVGFSNSCGITSNVLSYQRCNCLCVPNQGCTDNILLTVNNSITSVSTPNGFSDGQTLTLEINTGICPDTLRIKAGSTVLLELSSTTISSTTKLEMESGVTPSTRCSDGIKLNGITVGSLFIGDGVSDSDFDIFDVTYLSNVFSYTTPVMSTQGTPCSGCGSQNRTTRALLIQMTIDATIANIPITFENFGTITSSADDPISKAASLKIICNP